MEILKLSFVIFIMVSMTAVYFIIGYKFLKKYRGKDNGNNKGL